MTKKPAMTAGAAAPAPWGWEQPQCRGRNALALFVDDLHRILESHAAGRLANAGSLDQAQRQVDELLARYNGIGAAPEAFQGASIELQEAVDRSGASHTVPIFSPRLKKSLMSMLGPKSN